MSHPVKPLFGRGWAGCYTVPMDIERTLELVVNTQATFATDLNDLRSLVGQLAQQQYDLTQIVGQFGREFSAAILALAENQKQMAENQKQLAENQKQLAEEHRHLTEKLNALIDVVDGLVRRPKSPE